MSQLHVAGLRKSYDGADVVVRLDLELEAGVCFGLLGPNGAGKTTTLRLCLGLTEPDAGRITMARFSGSGTRARSASTHWCRAADRQSRSGLHRT
jgi:ABC-type multidrug transport system ATPase subunit